MSSLRPEAGYNYDEIETARELALGGATRAFSAGTTGLYANPAGLALTRVYHLEGLVALMPQARRQSYGVTAVDSVTSRMAVGVGGELYNVQDPDGINRKWTDVRLGLALPFSDAVYVGLAGRYLKLRQAGLGPLGSSFASGGLSDQPIVDGVSFDAGLVVRPTDKISIGLVGTNITNPGNGLQPTSFGGGIGFGNEDITVEGDLLTDFTTFVNANGSSHATVRAMGGFEYLLADHYPARIGYRYDEGEHTHSFSFGLGYIDQQFSLDFGLRHSFSDNPYAPLTSIVINLAYFLEGSSGLAGGEGD